MVVMKLQATVWYESVMRDDGVVAKVGRTKHAVEIKDLSSYKRNQWIRQNRTGDKVVKK